MAVTQADIDAMNDAIKANERVVVKDGESVTYRSVDDIIKARDDLVKQMQDAELKAAGKARPKRTYAYYAGRGYH